MKNYLFSNQIDFCKVFDKKIKKLYNKNIGNDNSTNVVLPNRFEKTHTYLAKYRCEFFIIYVVAYQPSSYTELQPRQRLMLKKTLRIILKIVSL